MSLVDKLRQIAGGADLPFPEYQEVAWDAANLIEKLEYRRKTKDGPWNEASTVDQFFDLIPKPWEPKPDAQDFVRYFCALCNLVHEKAINSDESRDCFCGEGGLWPKCPGASAYNGEHANGFRNSGEAAKFIHDRVMESLGFPAKANESSPKELTLYQIGCEVGNARRKFPSNEHLTVALMEEAGELANAMIEHGPGSQRVREEAIQVAAVAIRIIEEGDADFPVVGGSQ